MTKKEYLRALKNEIQALPHNEQKEALDYYENYFLDAGVENEQKVIEELGDVKTLAKEIILNFACVPQRVENPKSKRNNDKKDMPTSNKWIIAIILILTFPIWIHIVAAVFCILVSLLALGFSGIVAALAIFVTAIATIVLAVWAFATNPLVSVFILGTCLILIGLGILAWIVGIWFFAKFAPWVWNGAKKIYCACVQKVKSKI